MANISLQHVKSHTYVYVSTSYRNEMKKPVNSKIKIGKIDQKTKELLISAKNSSKYANLLAGKMPIWEAQGIISDTRSRLQEAVKKNFPNDWSKILTVVYQVLFPGNM